MNGTGGKLLFSERERQPRRRISRNISQGPHLYIYLDLYMYARMYTHDARAGNSEGFRENARTLPHTSC